MPSGKVGDPATVADVVGTSDPHATTPPRTSTLRQTDFKTDFIMAPEPEPEPARARERVPELPR